MTLQTCHWTGIWWCGLLRPPVSFVLLAGTPALGTHTHTIQPVFPSCNRMLKSIGGTDGRTWCCWKTTLRLTTSRHIGLTSLARRSPYAWKKLMTCFRLLAGLQCRVNKTRAGQGPGRHTVEHSISWTPENQTGEKGINSLQPFSLSVDVWLLLNCCCVVCIYVSATWEKKKRKWSVRKRRKRERKKRRRRSIPREAEVRRRCRALAILLPLDLIWMFSSLASFPHPRNELMINDGLNCD